jgi:hypothetical protein
MFGQNQNDMMDDHYTGTTPRSVAPHMSTNKKQKTREATPNERVRARMSEFGRESLDNAADGNCFWYVLSDQTGIPVPDLRRGTAKRMREHPAKYDGFGDFVKYGGYEAYCDLVENGSVFLVQGNAEVCDYFVSKFPTIGRIVYLCPYLLE